MNEYDFKPYNYTLVIWYNNTEFPMRVERKTVEQLERWMESKINVKKNFKNSKSWQIKDLNGKTVKEGIIDQIEEKQKPEIKYNPTGNIWFRLLEYFRKY